MSIALDRVISTYMAVCLCLAAARALVVPWVSAPQTPLPTQPAEAQLVLMAMQYARRRITKTVSCPGHHIASNHGTCRGCMGSSPMQVGSQVLGTSWYRVVWRLPSVRGLTRGPRQRWLLCVRPAGGGSLLSSPKKAIAVQHPPEQYQALQRAS